MTRLIYIAGKYRAPTEYEVWQNIEHARAAAIRILQDGNYFPITPHLNTAMLGGVVPDDVFLAGDFEIIQRCDAIYMLTGWRDSEGARQEWEVAQRTGIAIFYDDECANPPPHVDVRENSYTPIEVLHMKPRAVNALLDADIGSVEELVRLPAKYLMSMRGIGSATVKEIKRALDVRGMTLAA